MKNIFLRYQNTSLLRTIMIVVFTLIVAVFANVTFAANFSGAQSPAFSDADADQCWRALNGKSFGGRPGDPNSPDFQLFDSKCRSEKGGNCTGNPTSKLIECALPPGSEQDIQNKTVLQLITIYSGGVAESVCNSEPPSDRDSCYQTITAISGECLEQFFINGDESGEVVFPNINVDSVRSCIVEKSGRTSASERRNIQSGLMSRQSQAGRLAEAERKKGIGERRVRCKGTWNAETNNCDNGSGTSTASTCAVEGIGWIVCPVMTFIGSVTDQAYLAISSFMVVEPILPNTNSSRALYSAWSLMRNFANVCFVIAFLIIIFSQVTSAGITNYGVKKLLPRIIIAAILVNVSYWLCAAAIDVSNIIGSALSGLFESIIANAKLIDQGQPGNNFNGGNGWVNVIGAVLAATATGGILIYAGLSVLLPIVITAALAVMTIVIVLVARQALIILLIVVSPIAFVAYLLPNTEGLFKKWFVLFRTLLFLFPVIALGYGVCKLAGAILMATG